MGQAIVNGIRGETEQSSKLTNDAAQFLKERTVERSRSWTLTYAHLVFVVSSAILSFLFSMSNMWHCWQIIDPSLLWLAIQGGIIGAYLSVVRKAGRGEWDAAAGRSLHLLEVFTKLFAGGILGGIAFVLSRSVDAPLSLKQIAPDEYSALLLGIAAGLFEQLIPKMISTYSDFGKTQNT